MATGACTIVAPRVTRTSTVYLPRWVSHEAVQPALLAWWQKMVDHMAWHEGQHIKIRKSYDSKLKTLMAGHNCSSANKIIKKWQRSQEAAQSKFTRRTRSGRIPSTRAQAGSTGRTSD